VHRPENLNVELNAEYMAYEDIFKVSKV